MNKTKPWLEEKEGLEEVHYVKALGFYSRCNHKPVEGLRQSNDITEIVFSKNNYSGCQVQKE